ncbi:Uma2 family endonuclease [Synechococcus sp. PCC 7336]|uniref:Uma2 family endonuclease n=1 Tax=Synechococcus sp. PCC 7336 TaxID=195250 RepID=UPI000349ED61|nr:Uma2 family endonuclease [Synechococcus sp. PCC 7336]
MTTTSDNPLKPTVSVDVVAPPGDLESVEPQLETYLHLQQMIVLLTSLEWLWRDRDDFFAAGNLTIYFSPRQIKSQDFRGPDFFVVLDTERKPRKSWVVWQEEGRYPNVIVEVLSDSTAASDRGQKKQIYQDVFRTPDYFWVDPSAADFSGFHLMDGSYRPIPPNERGHLWSEQLGLYLGIHDRQLRFFHADGQLVETPPESAISAFRDVEREAERAERAIQRAQLEAERAERATQRAEREAERAEREAERAEREAERAEREAERTRILSERLSELGIDPDSV